nr:YbfB/YjiJ family MFS transporter [Rhizobium leguminosarum]
MPFTAISFFAMNEVRRIRARNHARYMGLLTAVFAVGQITGPPVVGIILARTASIDAGFGLSLGLASIALVVGAAIFVAMIMLYPSERRRARG